MMGSIWNAYSMPKKLHNRGSPRNNDCFDCDECSDVSVVMCTTQRYTTSCSTVRSESYVLLYTVVETGTSRLQLFECFFSEAMFSSPRRLVASSEKMAALSFLSRECRPATASYKLTEWPTSRNLLDVSASRAMFCAKATRTIRDVSVIRWATFLKTYRGNKDASDGGNVDTASEGELTNEQRDSLDEILFTAYKIITHLITRTSVQILQMRVQLAPSPEEVM